MKKIITLAVFFMVCLSAFAQSGRSIYNRYSDEKGVTAVYISPAMFRLMGKLPDMQVGEEGSINLTNVVKSLEGLFIIESENKGINDNIKSDVEKYVRKGNFEVLMEVKEDGETVRMYTTGTKDIITGFVLLSIEPDETNFICLEGQLSRDDLDALLAALSAE